MRRAVGIGLVLTLLVLAFAQTATTLSVVRDDSTLVVTNAAQGAQGARSILRLPPVCEPGFRVSVFYGPPDDVTIEIDDETRLRSSLALITSPEDAEEGEEQETIELMDGTATFGERPACLESFEPAPESRVLLEQGRTTVVGTRFFLDRETDVATMDGPIELAREAHADSEELLATAQGLSYDLSTDRSTLTGAVVVQAGGRVSEAEALELDEEAGLATLVGSPAVSREGDNEIRGERLLYYLDSNDVVVIGGVGGTLDIDLE